MNSVIDPSTSQELANVEHSQLQRMEIPAEPSAGHILARAMELMAQPGSGFTIEAFEKLVALKERAEDKKAETDLESALRDFRRNCPQILKTRTVKNKAGEDMYRFANLEDVKAVVDPRLSGNDLSYSWDSKFIDGVTTTTCTLRHIGGGKRSANFTSGMAGAPSMNSAQAAGSTLSYGQRYSLLAVLGLSADLDDDGRSANRLPSPEPVPSAPVVGTRQQRQDESNANPAPSVNPEVGPLLKSLYNDWRKKYAPAEKGHEAWAKFAAWGKKTLRTELDMRPPESWSLDAVAACREAM
ncbi:MAG TPA: ERF family protein [Planctomycetaceae bacterium]